MRIPFYHPTIDRNIQSVTIVSDSGEATMTMKNVPSPENPKTGRIVAQSVLATLAPVMRDAGQLPGDTAVSTIMTNLALRRLLR